MINPCEHPSVECASCNHRWRHRRLQRGVSFGGIRGHRRHSDRTCRAQFDDLAFDRQHGNLPLGRARCIDITLLTPAQILRINVPLGFSAQEVILAEGRPVGELTSRARLPGWPAILALGLLDAERWHGEPVAVVASGQLWPPQTRLTHWAALAMQTVV